MGCLLAWWEWEEESTWLVGELGEVMISTREDMLLPRECLCLMPTPAPPGLLAEGGGDRTFSGRSPGQEVGRYKDKDTKLKLCFTVVYCNIGSDKTLTGERRDIRDPPMSGDSRLVLESEVGRLEGIVLCVVHSRL